MEVSEMTDSSDQTDHRVCVTG